GIEAGVSRLAVQMPVVDLHKYLARVEELGDAAVDPPFAVFEVERREEVLLAGAVGRAIKGWLRATCPLQLVDDLGRGHRETFAVLNSRPSSPNRSAMY